MGEGIGQREVRVARRQRLGSLRLVLSRLGCGRWSWALCMLGSGSRGRRSSRTLASLDFGEHVFRPDVKQTVGGLQILGLLRQLACRIESIGLQLGVGATEQLERLPPLVGVPELGRPVFVGGERSAAGGPPKRAH